MKTAKRLLSLFLCAVMWFSCLGTAGVTAFEDDHDHGVGEVSATAANEAVPTALGTEEVTITVKRDPADGSFDSGHYCLAPTVSVSASAGHNIVSVEMNGEKVEDYTSFKPTDNKIIPGAGGNVTVTVTYDTNKTKSLSFSFGHTLTGKSKKYYTAGNCTVECQIFVCTICGSQWGDIVVNGQHNNWGEKKTIESCDGKTYEIQICEDCGYCYRTDKPDQDAEHVWKTTKEAADPKCGEFSVNVEECEKCGEVRTTVVFGTHTYSGRGEVKQPTCTDKGTRTVTCTKCGEEQTYSVSALGHNYDKGTVTKVADCQNEGVKTYTCSRCGAKQTETIPKGEHQYIPGDCTDGIKCSVCQKVVIEATAGHNMTYIPAGIGGHIHYCQNKYCEESESEPHKFTSSYDPTTGDTLLYCSVCKFRTTEHTHDFGSWTSSADGKYHERTCKTCGTVEKASHTPEADDGDCTTEVKCKVCGGIAVEARSEHEFTEVDNNQRNNDGHKLKCKYCTKFSDVIEHVPEDDDGTDCTKDIHCKVCRWIVKHGNETHNSIGGKMVYDDEYHWMICANPGCTQDASQKSRHMTNPELAAKDCSEPEYCSICGYLMRPAGTHDWEIVKDNGNGTHHVKCKLCKEEADVPHEFADDGDCTTADPCVCGALSEKQESHNYGKWEDIDASNHKGTCQNDGCKATTTEKHNIPESSGDCTKSYTCTVCGYVSRGNAKHSWSTEATPKDDGHVYTCTNPGCKAESEVQAHVAKDRKYCTDDVVCKICKAVIEKGETAHHLISTTDTTRVDISEKHEVRCDNPGCSYIKGWEEHKSNHANETDCTKDSICEDCKCVLVKGEKHPGWKTTITDTGHSKTCTKCGYTTSEEPHQPQSYYDCTKEKRCYGCGYVLDGPLNPEHKLGDPVDDENGTTHTAKCIYCDYKETHDHTYDPDRKWDENLVCTECGYVKEKADEHKWGTAVDNGDGTHVYTCSFCGVTRSEKHSGGTATCTKKAVCEACGASYGDVDKTNHTGIVDEWKSDGSNHWKVCSACGEKINVSAHSGGKAACTKKAVCAVCGASYGDVDKTNHTGIVDEWKSDGTSHWKVCSACGEKINVSAHSGGKATCTKKAVCAVCGASYDDVDKTNHTGIVDEWKSDGSNHWKVCSACGDKLELAPHTYENGKCTVCGAADGSYTPPATTDPADTTAKPADTTAEPADTTAKPADTTAEPADTTAEPADTTAEPADTAAEPADTTGSGSDQPPKTGDRDGALFIVLFAVSMVGAAVVATGVITSRRREDR